jgi:cell division septation protein DedD
MTSELRAERDEVVGYETEDEGRKRRPLVTGLIAFGALAGFALAVGYAYQKGREAGLNSVAPVITAGPGPYKVKPDDPGGMAVPYRNMEIYGRLAGSPPLQPSRETLLPPPEQPIAPPRAAPSAPAPAPPDAPPKAVATPQVSPPPAAPHDPSAKSIAEAVQGAANGHKVAPGTVKPETARQTAKVAPAAGGAYRVQLGAVRSADEARGAWTRLQKSHSDLLGALALSVDRKDMGAGKGVFFRMQAGPIANESDARGLCSRLKQRKVDCLVVGL